MTLIAGIGILLVGLVAIGFGIQDKEFEVGKTLILAGTVVACSGIIMLGLSVVVRELRNIARRLGPADPVIAGRAKSEPQLPVAGADQSASENLDGAEPAGKQSPSASTPAPWQEAVAARDRGRGDGAPEAAPAEPAAATKPRRNLLFSSSSRRSANARRARPMRPPPIPPLRRRSRLRHRKKLLPPPPPSKMPGRNRNACGPMHCGAPAHLRPSPSRMRQRLHPHRSVPRRRCRARSRPR